MTIYRIQSVRVAVLGVTALVMLLHAPSWAQSKRSGDTAAPLCQ